MRWFHRPHIIAFLSWSCAGTGRRGRAADGRVDQAGPRGGRVRRRRRVHRTDAVWQAASSPTTRSARRDAARGGRLRGVPELRGRAAGSDPDADRPRRRRRPGPRARRGRRRLPHQALQLRRLAARVRALIRRGAATARPSCASATSRWIRLPARWRGEDELALSTKEFALLSCSCGTPTRCCPGRRSSSTCGTSPTTASPTCRPVRSYLRRKVDRPFGVEPVRRPCAAPVPPAPPPRPAPADVA